MYCVLCIFVLLGHQVWFTSRTRICASSQCMQSALSIQEYLGLKVCVHKPFVLSRYLYCKKPKNPGYAVRFTIKTPALCLQYKMFRLQVWKMASMERCKNTEYKWQLMFFEPFSGEIHWFTEVLCEQIEWKKYFLFYKCHVTLLVCFYFVLFLSDTVLFYFILQTKAVKTKNWHRMNLQLI